MGWWLSFTFGDDLNTTRSVSLTERHAVDGLFLDTPTTTTQVHRAKEWPQRADESRPIAYATILLQNHAQSQIAYRTVQQQHHLFVYIDKGMYMYV